MHICLCAGGGVGCCCWNVGTHFTILLLDSGCTILCNLTCWRAVITVAWVCVHVCVCVYTHRWLVASSAWCHVFMYVRIRVLLKGDRVLGTIKGVRNAGNEGRADPGTHIAAGLAIVWLHNTKKEKGPYKLPTLVTYILSLHNQKNWKKASQSFPLCCLMKEFWRNFHLFPLYPWFPQGSILGPLQSLHASSRPDQDSRFFIVVYDETMNIIISTWCQLNHCAIKCVGANERKIR